MTLQPITELLTPAERVGTCDCGVPFTQQGYGTPNGKGILWRPMRCAACEEQHRLAQVERAENERREVAELARIQLQMKCDAAVRALNVPEIYRGVTLGGFELHGSPEDRAKQTRALSHARGYLAEWPDVAHLILILRGVYGSGKGHWAYSVAQHLAAQEGVSARVVKVADMVRRLRRSWRHPEGESEDEVLVFYRTLDLLVIDDVSRHAFYGEQIHQHLYDVIDHRMEYRRPTILTTNESDAGIRELLRGALWDRVHGSGGVLEFGDSSYRIRSRLTGSPAEAS
jgi:DNA replication protein DnaC